MTLHDQTRRIISLLLFFILGPLLTLGILAGIVLRKIPANARKFEYNAAVQTGLTWKIDAVEYRSFYCTRLKNVRLLDSFSAKTIFFAPEIDCRYIISENFNKFFPGIETNSEHSDNPILPFTASVRPNGFQQIFVPDSVLTFDHDSASAVAVRDTLEKILARFHLLSETPVQFVFENVGIFSVYSKQRPDEKPDRVRFVRGNLYRTKNEIRSDWEFQVPEFSELETQQFSVIQKRQVNNVEITLRTGKIPVPCELAAVFCSAFRRFGHGSRFSGEFSVEKNSNPEIPPTLRLKNVSFKDIDMAPFAEEYTPFSVSGTMRDLQMTHAALGPNIFTAEGCFQIVDGSIEKTLFQRIIERFNLIVKPSDISESPRTMIPFTACAVHFRLQPEGVVFRPDELWQNALMHQVPDASGLGKMTVYFPDENRRLVSFHTLFSIFAPDTAPVVPLTPGLKNLFFLLPMDDFRNTNVRSENTNQIIEPFIRKEPVPVQAELKPSIADPALTSPNVLFVNPPKKHNNKTNQ
ncbi:MAG: hypothetical protein LBU34_14300 [Planctomycetaceae bacterium]|nr:hypothetical protein [Planctomycetaceae bacterium]